MSSQEWLQSSGQGGSASELWYVSLPQKSTIIIFGQLLVMKGESAEARVFPNGNYKIRRELDSGVADSRRIKDYVYYFTYCEGKKGKDNSGSYDKGYLCLIHHIYINTLTLFFKKSKKIIDLSSQQNDLINFNGYEFSKFKQVNGSKFLIQYQVENNSFHMQVRLQSEEVANKWREFISAYKPETVNSSKNAKNGVFEEQKQTDALLSTKDSKTSIEDQRKLAKILDYKASSQRMDNQKCQFCLKDYQSIQLEHKIGKLQDLLNIERDKVKVYSMQVQQNKRSHTEKYDALLQEKRKIQQRLNACQAQIKKLKQERKTTLQTTVSFEQNSQLKKNVSILQDKNSQLGRKLHSLEKQLKENQRKDEIVEQQKKVLNHKLKQALKENHQLNEKIKDITRKFQDKCDHYEYQIEERKKAQQSLIHSNDSFKKQIKTLQDQIAAQKHDVKHAERIQKIKKDYEAKQMSLKAKYETKLAQLTQKCQYLQNEVVMAKASHGQSTKLIKTLIFNGVFNGGILDNLDAYKQFLVNEIQSYMNRSIIKTKLLYRFEPLNKVNFHNYIDSCSNLVLIARTSSGYYTAAFTESPFFPKSEANDGGLLLSLTNYGTYRCLEGKKAITYDEYYIIFGNSELRIKSLQDRIFSNFGISNGFYNSNGLKVDALFGQNEREVDLDAYEIYQIHFS